MNRVKLISISGLLVIIILATITFLFKQKEVQLPINYDKQISDLQKEVIDLKNKELSQNKITKNTNLVNIKKISEDKSVFSDPAFKVLTNTTVPLAVDNVTDHPYSRFNIPQYVFTPPVIVQPAPVQYSDYNFDYKWYIPTNVTKTNSPNSAYITCPVTNRRLVVTKAVFKISDEVSDKLKEIDQKHLDNITLREASAANNTSGAFNQGVFDIMDKDTWTTTTVNSSTPLERVDNNTFLFLGSTYVCGLNNYNDSSSGINVSIGYFYKVPNPTTSADIYYVPLEFTPVMSEWKVFDQTTNKPVKIN